jgi:hypothetical protein
MFMMYLLIHWSLWSCWKLNTDFERLSCSYSALHKYNTLILITYFTTLLEVIRLSLVPLISSQGPHVFVIDGKGKGKVKLSLCLTKHHAMKMYWVRGGTAPRILDLGARWRWMVSFTPRPLYSQGKSSQNPLDRRVGEPQSRSGRGGEEKNSQPPPGIEP